MSDVKTKFTLHTEYKDFVPGLTPIQFGTLSRLKDSLSCGCSGLVFSLFLFGTIFLAYITIYGVTQDMLFLLDGHPIPVQVTGCHMASSGNGMHPNVVYTYAVKEKIYSGSDTIRRPRRCEDYPVGTSLQAVYVVSEPQYSHLSSDVSNHSPLDGLGTSLILLGLAAFAILKTVRMARFIYHYGRARQIYPRLSAHSMLLEGEITHIWSASESKGTEFYVMLHYRFETSQKIVITGYAEALRQDLRDKELPPVGTPVTILYADNDAHMML